MGDTQLQTTTPRTSQVSLSTTPSPLLTLPPELMINVFENLNPSSLIAASQSCREFRSIYFNNNGSLWRTMAFKEPSETARKYFRYVIWMEQKLLKLPDQPNKTFNILGLNLPRFYNGFLARTLSPIEEQQVVPRLNYELNRLAVIAQICKYDQIRNIRFILFKLSLQLDDHRELSGDLQDHGFTVDGPEYLSRSRGASDSSVEENIMKIHWERVNLLYSGANTYVSIEINHQ